MEIKKLTFVERFVDEEPPTDVRYWRGIMVYCDDLVLFHIDYFPQKNELDDETCFIIRSNYFPHEELFNDISERNVNNKEDAMKNTQEAFEKIVNTFLIKNK